jgi:hypothetical protein
LKTFNEELVLQFDVSYKLFQSSISGNFREKKLFLMIKFSFSFDENCENFVKDLVKLSAIHAIYIRLEFLVHFLK